MMHGAREVGPRHRSCEADEQSEESSCGGVLQGGDSGVGESRAGPREIRTSKARTGFGSPAGVQPALERLLGNL